MLHTGSEAMVKEEGATWGMSSGAARVRACLGAALLDLHEI